jgi:hypothetical protein
MYQLCTYFDDSTWLEFGSNWLNKAKRNQFEGIVLAYFENAKNLERLQDFCEGSSLKVLSLQKKINFAEASKLVSENFDEVCLLTKPNILPVKGLPETKGGICSISQKDESFFDVVSVITSIRNRAKVFGYLEDLKSRYGNILSADYILGTAEFWSVFSGLQSYLLKKGFFEEGAADSVDCPDLFLNISFSQLTSVPIEVIKDQ